MKQIGWIGLASVLLTTWISVPAGAWSDDCANWGDAGNNWIEAYRLSKDVTCSGDNAPWCCGGDWYFVDVALADLSDSISVTTCSSTTQFTSIYFVPAASLLPWTGTDLGGNTVGNPVPPGLTRVWDSGASCFTVSSSVSLTAAGGRWYINVGNGCGSCSSAPYTLSIE